MKSIDRSHDLVGEANFVREADIAREAVCKRGHVLIV